VNPSVDDWLESISSPSSGKNHPYPELPAFSHPPTFRSPPTQLIEQTAKRWKAWQAVGGILLIVATLFLCIAIFLSIDPSNHPIWNIAKFCYLFAGVFGVVGLISYNIGRIGAWWYHG
jgi:hypothetical protein